MRWHYWLLTLLYCSVIFYASSQPAERLPVQPFPGSDKVVHGILYGALAALISSGMRHSRRPHPAWACFWLPVLFATAYGLSDEFHQYFVPTRSADVWDLAADACGALVAQVALFVLFRRSFVHGGMPDNGNDLADG